MSESAENRVTAWEGATHVAVLGRTGNFQVSTAKQFWEDIGVGEGGGVVVSQFETCADWDRWEMHPAGDELIVQLSGSMRLLLERTDGPTEILLDQGQMTVVPKGVWHTADMITAGRSLYFTLGDGTEGRARGA